MDHEGITQKYCDYAIRILKADKLRFRPMKRKTRVNPKRGFIIGRTNLKTGLIKNKIIQLNHICNPFHHGYLRIQK